VDTLDSAVLTPDAPAVHTSDSTPAVETTTATDAQGFSGFDDTPSIHTAPDAQSPPPVEQPNESTVPNEAEWIDREFGNAARFELAKKINSAMLEGDTSDPVKFAESVAEVLSELHPLRAEQVLNTLIHQRLETNPDAIVKGFFGEDATVEDIARGLELLKAQAAQGEDDFNPFAADDTPQRDPSLSPDQQARFDAMQRRLDEIDSRTNENTVSALRTEVTNELEKVPMGILKAAGLAPDPVNDTPAVLQQKQTAAKRIDDMIGVDVLQNPTIMELYNDFVGRGIKPPAHMIQAASVALDRITRAAIRDAQGLGGLFSRKSQPSAPPPNLGGNSQTELPATSVSGENGEAYRKAQAAEVMRRLGI